jgi:xanthine/uracil permease
VYLQATCSKSPQKQDVSMIDINEIICLGVAVAFLLLLVSIHGTRWLRRRPIMILAVGFAFAGFTLGIFDKVYDTPFFDILEHLFYVACGVGFVLAIRRLSDRACDVRGGEG